MKMNIEPPEYQNAEKMASTPLADLIGNIDEQLDRTVELGVWHENSAQSMLHRDNRNEQYIRFQLGRYNLILPMERTLEIGYRPVITALPNLPGWLIGVSNIRGEIVSVIDLAGFLDLGADRPKSGERFMLVHNNRIKTGFIVDRITGLYHLQTDNDRIQPDPDHSPNIGPYVKGIVNLSEETLHILDIEALLASERLNCFTRT